MTTLHLDDFLDKGIIKESSFRKHVENYNWNKLNIECKHYAEFSDFKHAIIECLGQTHTTYKSELDTLLTPRFQTFEKTQFLAA